MTILVHYPPHPTETRETGLLAPSDGVFDVIAAGVLDTLNGSSARVYGITFQNWARWCAAAGVDPLDLRPARVAEYLRGRNLARATAARELAALRKLTRMAYVLTGRDEFQRLAMALQEMKAPGAGGQARSLRALSPGEAAAMLAAWPEEEPRAERNRAIVALLLCAGLRRAEVAALRVDGIDLSSGIVQIVGKGDKRRDAPIVGGLALHAVARWHELLDGRFTWAFPAIHRGGWLQADQPISGGDVYRVWNETAHRAGVHATPHDARRTFITELLLSGVDPRNVQSIVGHARGDTTLRYAQAAQVRAIRDELRLRYA